MQVILTKTMLVRALLVGSALLIAAPVQAQTKPEPMPGDFVVVDGRVDAGTYAGWRLFHSTCHTCHGVGGIGTGKAPNLVERIGQYTPRGFATKVLTSYRLLRMTPDDNPPDLDAERAALLEEVMRRERSARGQPVMPAWDDNGDVPPHVLDLYAYLNARAQGGLGPDKPRQIDSRKR